MDIDDCPGLAILVSSHRHKCLVILGDSNNLMSGGRKKKPPTLLRLTYVMWTGQGLRRKAGDGRRRGSGCPITPDADPLSISGSISRGSFFSAATSTNSRRCPPGSWIRVCFFHRPVTSNSQRSVQTTTARHGIGPILCFTRLAVIELAVAGFRQLLQTRTPFGLLLPKKQTTVCSGTLLHDSIIELTQSLQQAERRPKFVTGRRSRMLCRASPMSFVDLSQDAVCQRNSRNVARAFQNDFIHLNHRRSDIVRTRFLTTCQRRSARPPAN